MLEKFDFLVLPLIVPHDNHHSAFAMMMIILTYLLDTNLYLI